MCHGRDVWGRSPYAEDHTVDSLLEEVEEVGIFVVLVEEGAAELELRQELEGLDELRQAVRAKLVEVAKE